MDAKNGITLNEHSTECVENTTKIERAHTPQSVADTVSNIDTILHAWNTGRGPHHLPIFYMRQLEWVCERTRNWNYLKQKLSTHF